MGRSYQWLRYYGSRFFLILWLWLTLAAVAGMYHLWWTRERVLYLGKDPHEQRAEVFRRAGISASLLDPTERIMGHWPEEVRYSLEGDYNQLSYVKYLLIPRIPGDSAVYAIEEEEGRLKVRPPLPETGRSAEIHASAHGFFLSLFILFGLALLLRRIPGLVALGIPEYAGMAAFLLSLAVIASRGILKDASAGFWLVVAAGIAGWIVWITTLKAVAPCVLKRLTHSLRTSWHAIAGRWSASWWIPVSLVVIAVAIPLWSVLMSVVVVPDDWDAWAIWGPKAKVLAMGRGPLEEVTAFGHADYPLLWPAVWAFSGWCGGGWEEHWSRAWGPVFMILTAWQISVIIRRFTQCPGISWFGAALFLSMPMVPLLASWSYAEPPLWLLMTCAFGRLLSWRQDGETSHLVIAALFAAAAAYTKNEGLFFAAVCFVWLVLTRPRRTGVCLLWYALPAGLLYLPWVGWVRGILHLGSRPFDGFEGGAAAAARALERAPDAVLSIIRMWSDPRQWNLVVWFIVALSIWHLVKRKGLQMDLFVPLVMLLVFFTINVFHPEEIGLIMSSWNRLTVQTMPLFMIILGIRYLPILSGRSSHET